MDLDELRRVQATERRTDSLQNLRDSFYQEAANHIADLKQRRDERAAAVEDPFADGEVRRLSDRIETAEEVAESIYERRVGKVVNLASFAASGTDVDTEGLTDPEAELFDDLVDRITSNKESVLDVIDSGAPAGDVTSHTDPATTSAAETSAPTSEQDASATDSPTSSPDDATADGGVLADALGTDTGDDQSSADEGATAEGDTDTTSHPPEESATQGDTPPIDPPGASEASQTGAAGSTGDVPGGTNSTDGDTRPAATVEAGTAADEDTPELTTAAGPAPADETEDDRRTVRITEDVGRIYGVDEREYDLKPNDVVTLPAVNAEPLVERDAAEPVE